MPRKLGKLPKREDRRTLKLAHYGLASLPEAPAAWDLTGKVTHLGELLNDKLGDCTCAAAGHLVQSWTAETGSEYIPSDQSILTAYEAVGGYVPGEPNTDQGAVCLDVLNYWRQTGVAGHEIRAYASINPTSIDEIKKSVYYFGGAYCGFSLPAAFDSGVLDAAWNYAGQEGSDWQPDPSNGHCVPIVAYDEQGVTVITWGQLLKANWAFVTRYMDESYACLSADMLAPDGQSPEGFNVAQLTIDLQEVTA